VVSPAGQHALPADGWDVDATTIVETTRGRIVMRGTLSAEQLAAIVAELVRGC
jgi:hypothetical protein